MTYEQRFTLKSTLRKQSHGKVVEPPCTMQNEVFGPTVYFTIQFGYSFVEYGIKPNGELFIVH